MQRRNREIAVILVVIGLMIGAGGGYFIANNSAQREINSLNDEISNLTSTVTGLESNILEFRDEISGFENQVQDYEASASEMESKIAQLMKENEEKDTTITELETQADKLSKLTMVRDGYARYSIYGFSFEYPVNMTTSLSGLMESIPTWNSGIFQAENGDGDTITVSWLYSLNEMDPNSSLDDGYDNIAESVITRGERETVEHQEHTVLYDEYLIEDESVEIDFVNSAFYCADSKNLFTISIKSTDEEPVSALFGLLDSFTCTRDVGSPEEQARALIVDVVGD
jgi:cell division protein FtsB